jgi:hypothetical protein
MKTTLLVAASLMLASAAHAEPMCYAWVQKGDNITCEMRAPSDGRGQADATAREAQRRNNDAWSYRSTTTHSDGTTSTTTTTFPRYR